MGYNYKLLVFLLQNTKRKLSYLSNISILDLCVNLNYIIPHYCYHSNLSIAGNCRMCLVELSTSQKPIVSCAMDVNPNSIIKTDTILVKKAREGIMEFLLVNHPLDCPVCDQGGECDLQEQSMIYGGDRGRFFLTKDFKRSVDDFMCHPMIKVILTRCIHCTRCVRFLNEVEGNYDLGMLGRGYYSEIGLYTDRLLTTELGSNITDFCPVGALTGKTYALQYRSWDDLYLTSIDLSDSLCSSIRVYSNFDKILRILPQYDIDLNISWITEKARYLGDSLVLQQLGYPLLRNTKFYTSNNLYLSLDSYKYFFKLKCNSKFYTKIKSYNDFYFINLSIINLTQKFNKLNFLKNSYEENLLKINLDNDKINFDLSVEDFFVSENLFFGLDSNLIDFLSNENEVISYYNNILGLFEVYDFLEDSNEMFQNFLDIDESFLNNKKVVLNVEEKNYVDILDLKKKKKKKKK